MFSRKVYGNIVIPNVREESLRFLTPTKVGVRNDSSISYYSFTITIQSSRLMRPVLKNNVQNRGLRGRLRAFQHSKGRFNPLLPSFSPIQQPHIVKSGKTF